MSIEQKSLKQIIDLAGQEFNINSTQQLAEILFDKLNLPMVKKRSTAEAVLKKLKEYHELPILILQYLNTGSDFQTSSFKDSENISADTTITHTSSYAAQVASATTFNTNASQTGSAVKVEEGVYFIRGNFVQVQDETILLSQYGNPLVLELV